MKADEERILEVHFIHDLPGTPDGVPSCPTPLDEGNVVVDGGERIECSVKTVETIGHILRVEVTEPGDFSRYALRVVTSPTNSRPPDGFDPELSEVDFSFKVDCPSDFDCKIAHACPPQRREEPAIDYLARDFASLRRLMLDRLAVLMPDWKERTPADVGVALVELAAYKGDYLSYFEDAVGTEAYLGTARKRVSIRRHARLLDYRLHDGCNARAWVHLRAADGAAAELIRRGVRLLTKVGPEGPVVDSAELEAELVSRGAQVFETMHDVTIRESLNDIEFYTWGEERCCLPKGATAATLKNPGDKLSSLKVGDLLLFEEVRGPKSGREEDADPTHRHVVRLKRVTFTEDPAQADSDDPALPIRVVEIEWGPEDSLPFPLCLWRVQKDGEGAEVPVGLARGNIVLADHGRTLTTPAVDVEAPGHLQLTLLRPLTHEGRIRTKEGRRVPFDPSGPACGAFKWTMESVEPKIEILEQNSPGSWTPERDLLESGPFARGFVVEIDEDSIPHFRFGDDVMGKSLPVGASVGAVYRSGNGAAGNVGAEAIASLVGARGIVTKVRNPLPAEGGQNAEDMEKVRLDAPQAFRRQERAVTEEDYGEVTARYPGVEKAVGTFRWTGSWYTSFVTVDREGGQEVDPGFEDGLREFLDRFRLAGIDLEVDGPVYVPLDISLTVCVAPGYYRSDVEESLLEVFSSRDLPDGRRGFFHQDNLTFGQPVYLSRVIATAMTVPGVRWVDSDPTPPKTNRFRRWGQPDRGELEAGRISLSRLEIARLDNDPSAPERGKIEFHMEGGL